MRHSGNPTAWPWLPVCMAAGWAPPQQVSFNRNLDACPRPIFYMRHFITFFLPVHKYSVFFLHNPQICSHSSLCDAQISFRRNHCASPRTNGRCSEKCLFQCSSNYAHGPPLDMSCIRCLHRE